ncbi:MAG TPA: PAS domain-containing protein [Caldilineae bacterium]|nr:PAS domain-containing protein [Caldilineae bacterium]
MTARENDSDDLVPQPPTSHHHGHATIGPDFHLQEASPSFQELVGECSIGARLDDILPVFAGVEVTLTEIMTGKQPHWLLKNVAHSRTHEGRPRFLNILVLSNRQTGGLLVTVYDVTDEAVVARRATQERNERNLQTRR